ncbi:MAG: ATP-binding protein [Armatimonadota bacterium]|nr:ATP-binding protein [Armatimonadota bacterium]
MMRSALGLKLFATYLVVIIVGIAVLVGSASLIAPRQFQRRIHGLGPGGWGPGRGLGPPATTLEHLYRSGLSSALLISGLAALLAAGVLSLYVSRRIVRPVQALAAATRRIAEGHYGERVPSHGRDEIGALADSFNAMAEALEQTETRRRALVADVAHELRTPLSGIKGYMEALTDGVLPADPEVFNRIATDVDRLQRLTADLEELSRLDAGIVVLTRRRMAPAALIRTVIERLQPQAEGKGLTIDVDVAASLPDVEVDADRIQQVLINVIGNAIQYTPAPGHIAVSARATGNVVQVDVTDTGIGIAPEHLPHVFERFFRVERSRTRAGGGSGLGLTIARYLVEAHGGRIWASSPGPGRGSTFSFTLPIAR